MAISRPSTRSRAALCGCKAGCFSMRPKSSTTVVRCRSGSWREGARRIALFNDGNPNPGVAVFNFGRLVPPEATIRIRLAQSQTVYAVAEMADGTYREASQKIAVTVGGCG